MINAAPAGDVGVGTTGMGGGTVGDPVGVTLGVDVGGTVLVGVPVDVGGTVLVGVAVGPT